MRIKYRKIHDVLEPRRTRLRVPGWSGEATHDVPQPWHCKPFSDASTYGFEIRFSWKAHCQVSLKRGSPVWSGDLTEELPPDAPPGWHPFSVFAPGYFGLSPLLDIEVPEGMGLFILPHPRCVVDSSGTAPIAIPGIVETHWWPRPFFIVFKAPTLRKTIEFNYGDPIAQLLVVPLGEKYEIEEMDIDLALSRNKRSLTLAKHGDEFSNQKTESINGYPSFNNKYKLLSRCARTQGSQYVATLLDKCPITTGSKNSNRNLSSKIESRKNC